MLQQLEVELSYWKLNNTTQSDTTAVSMDKQQMYTDLGQVTNIWLIKTNMLTVTLFPSDKLANL
jgi:hypothetical protein